MSKSANTRRVLFLFAHLHKGGMQRAVSNISLALPDMFEQYVGYFGTESPGFTYKAEMHDFCISGVGKTGLFGKISKAWHRLRALQLFVTEKNIDVVVSFGESANIYNVLSGHSARKIISSRVDLNESLADYKKYSGLIGFLVRLLYPRADLLVAVSEDLGHQMRQIIPNPNQVTVIPNLYHTQEIAQYSKVSLPVEMAFLENKRFILNVGSLCFQKGQDELLNIFARVQPCCEDVLLVIMGRGGWKNRLVNQAASLGILERLIFVDFDVNPYRYMSRASVFVLTSRFEGFPNALVEAMICGVPVVAFDCRTGPSEILGNNDFGFLVKNRSIDQATQDICALLKDDELSTSFKMLGLKRSACYSTEKVIEKWIKVLG